jgi:hypothetical protein
LRCFQGLVQNRRCSGDSTDREPENRMSHMNGTRMAQTGARWHLLGDFWAISLGPEATWNRALRERAELRSLQRKPFIMRSLVSVDSVCLQPISGPRSWVSGRPFDRETHASNVRARAGEGSVGHHMQRGRRDTGCAPRVHSIPLSDKAGFEPGRQSAKTREPRERDVRSSDVSRQADCLRFRCVHPKS